MANVPISNFTVPANTVGIGATGYSLTGSASASFMDVSGTWNTSGTPTLIKANVTDTSSPAGALFMDLQKSSVSMFKVDKSGRGQLAEDLWLKSDSTQRGLYLGSAADTMIGRNGTSGKIRFGLQDAAAPVAQTLSVQSVVAGTTNTAGANLTITGSQGTGTGAGGSIVFQVAPAGSSGTAQNALQTRISINTYQTELHTNVSTSSGAELIGVGALDGGGNILIASGSSGTGTNRSIAIRAGNIGSGKSVLIQSGATSTWEFASTGHILAGTDNTYDIGAATATRPRNVFIAGYNQLSEMTAPAAPAANGVRIYAEDDGAGKTRLMARFATGAAQQIAIEP